MEASQPPKKLGSLGTRLASRYKVGMFCVADFEASAREALGRNAWGYYSSGANQQQTLRDNVEAYSRY